MRWRLLLALLLGVAAAGSAVALLATSAWLITAASAQPPVLLLMVPIVAVRAFGVGRGVFRYVERLVGHDAAYRVLGETRARITGRLERLAPGGLTSQRKGDLLARLVLDVDAVLDLWLRVVLPVAVAAVTAAATVGLLALLLPTAGAAVALAVLIACTLVPWLTAKSAERAEQKIAGARGDVAATTTETLLTAGDIVAFNAIDDVLDAFSRRDARLAAAERRSAWSAGLGSALLVLCVGGASVAGLVLGSTAEHHRRGLRGTGPHPTRAGRRPRRHPGGGPTGDPGPGLARPRARTAGHAGARHRADRAAAAPHRPRPPGEAPARRVRRPRRTGRSERGHACRQPGGRHRAEWFGEEHAGRGPAAVPRAASRRGAAGRCGPGQARRRPGPVRGRVS